MAWRTSWLTRMAGVASVAQSGSRRHKPRYRSRLLLEPLEDRCVLTTITPTTFADGGLGSGSLRDAVLQFNADSGSDDDTILLQSGTYALTIRNSGGQHETAGLTGDLNLTRASHRWIIQGAGSSGPNATILDASQLQDRVFDIVTPGTQVVFKDLIIQGGLAQDDGSDGALAGRRDALGGGLLNNGGQVTLNNVVVQNNVARGGDWTLRHLDGFDAVGGGLYSAGGSLTISDSTFDSNHAVGGTGTLSGFGGYASGGWGQGGGLYASGPLTLINTTISRNTVSGGAGLGSGSGDHASGGWGQGGGLYARGGMLSLTNATVSANTATGGYSGDYAGTSEGGGVWVYATGTSTISNSTITANTATGGLGGAYAGTSEGGGVWVYATGTSTISNSTITANTLQGGTGEVGGWSQGGGVYGEGTVTVRNSTIAANNLHGGNGIYGGNGGAAQGGAVYGNGTLTVSNSTIAANTLQGGNGYGRYNGGAAQGGGVYGNGTLTVSNSTIAANTLQGGNGYDGGNGGAAQGGALYMVSGFRAHVTFSTIATNQATGGTHAFGNGSDGPATGGGVYNQGNTLQTDDTILADNTVTGPGTNTSPELFGNLGSLGYNLIGNTDGGSGFDPTDLLNVDPLLGPLQDNGGPTQTHALLAGSPALNAGNPSQLGVADQRGVVRSGGVNIGAYQASASTFVLTAPATVTAGTPFDVTVQAVDTFGQVAFGYTGTVTFSTTDPDPGVVLPGAYPFRAGDQGTHTFSGGFTLLTPGTWTLTAADAAGGFSTSVPVAVTSGGGIGQSPNSPRSPRGLEVTDRLFAALPEELTFPGNTSMDEDSGHALLSAAPLGLDPLTLDRHNHAPTSDDCFGCV